MTSRVRAFLGTPVLLALAIGESGGLPPALAGEVIHHRVYVPIASTTRRLSVEATPALPSVEPTSTARLPIEVRPPTVLLSSCFIRTERFDVDDMLASVTVSVTNRRGHMVATYLDGIDGEIPNGVVDRTTKVYYLHEWRRLRTEVYDGLMQLRSVSRNVYDDSGNMIAVEYDNNADGKVDSATHFEYDAAGRVVVRKTSSSTVTQEYDSQGRLVRTIHDMFGDGVPDFGTMYVWSQDRIAMIRDDHDGDGVVDAEWEPVYDDMGRLSELTDDITGTTRYQYYGLTDWPTEMSISDLSGGWKQSVHYSYLANGELRTQRSEDWLGTARTEFYRACPPGR